MEASKEVADVVIFLGRFHPLIVHLPIGILLVAVIMHFLAKKKRFEYLEKPVAFVLLIGAAGSIISCFLGYLLSFQGGYHPDTLFNHQWMGIGISCIAWLAYGFKIWEKTRMSFLINSSVMIVLVLGLGYVGHLGGNLTHGSTYLTQYAPNTIRKAVGLPPKQKERSPVTVLDSADIFLDVINPMIFNKCTSCHNASKSKGGLLLTSHDFMLKGGESGPAIVDGNLRESELFRRITLSENHKDFMPPEGKQPFSEEDVKLIEFWILNGAKPNGLLANIEVEDKDKKLFEDYLGLRIEQNSPLLRVVEAADSILINSLRLKGFIVKKISNASNLLDVGVASNKDMALQNIKDLLLIKDQIVYLNLSKSELKDSHLKSIGELENLIKLNVHSNPISNSGVAFLSKLRNLESLNLYNTSIGDEGLDIVLSLKKLKRLYLWKTHVSREKVKGFETSNSDLNIILGT